MRLASDLLQSMFFRKLNTQVFLTNFLATVSKNTLKVFEKWLQNTFTLTNIYHTMAIVN